MTLRFEGREVAQGRAKTVSRRRSNQFHYSRVGIEQKLQAFLQESLITLEKGRTVFD